MELYLHSPSTPSWRGALLNKSTGTTLPLPLPSCVRFVARGGLEFLTYHPNPSDHHSICTCNFALPETAGLTRQVLCAKLVKVESCSMLDHVTID
jgi:hypothetical protein